LLEISDRSISVQEAFATADQVLLAGVQGITDLITTPGLINLDFADVKSVMQGAGSALMGIGSSRGADRAIKAAELAVASPLLEASIEGARGVLLSIQGGSNLGLFEINDAAALVGEAVHPEANIIFGAVIDDTLGDEIRVTVIAAGFDGGEPTHKPMPRREFSSTDTGSVLPAGESIYAESPIVSSATGVFSDDDIAAVLTTPAAHGQVTLTPSYVDEDDDLDIPDFLK
jgi:cell division protein FtsZ